MTTTPTTPVIPGQAVPSDDWNTNIDNIADLETRTTALEAGSILPNYITGLTLSNAADGDHDIIIDTGLATNSDNDTYLSLVTAITKQIDATWAEGTNQGGLFSGASLTADTFYYLFLIEKDTDGTIDAGFDDNIIGTNAPAGWTDKRRIRGAVLTDGSGNILPIEHVDNRIRYTTIIQDIVNTSPGTSRNTGATSVPPGFLGIFNFGVISTSVGYLLFQETSETDAAAGVNNYHVSVNSNATRNNIETTRRVDSASEVAYRSSTANADIYISSIGFYDNAQ